MTVSPKLFSARLHHMCLRSADPSELAAFYGKALNYQVTEWSADTLASGPDRALVFEKGPSKTLSFAAYAVADPRELQGLRERLDGAGCPLEDPPRNLCLLVRP